MDVHEKLEQLRAEVEPYCPRGLVHLEVGQSDRLIPNLRLLKEEDREAVESILSKYKDVFPLTRVYLQMHYDFISTQLADFRFREYQDLLTSSLRDACATLRQMEKRIYLFSVYLDTGNYSIWLGACSEDFCKGTTPGSKEHVFNCYGSGWEDGLEFPISPELQDLLVQHEKAISESYSRYGEFYLVPMSQAYDLCMIESTGKALRRVNTDFETVPRTDDFIASVEPSGVEDWIHQFALRQTLDSESIDRIFAPVISSWV